MKGLVVVLPLVLGAFFCFQVIQSVHVDTVYSWSPFVFENLPHKEQALVDGHHQYYNSCSILPYGLSYNRPKECIFFAIPRRAHGIPATVAFFNRNQYPHDKSPPLCGFPTYVHNYVPGWFGVNDLPGDDYKYSIYPGYTKTTPYRKSHHFVSVVYTVKSADCVRLYFVDTGTLEYPEGNICVRPPVLWGFSIDGCSEHEFDKPPAFKVSVPENVYKDPTGFGAFDVDTYGNCEEFAIYLPNYKDNKIVVYDNVKKSFWYFQHKTFNPLAEAGYLNGYNAPHDHLNLGVLSVIVGPEQKGYCDVYYAPGSSCGLFKTSSKALRDYSQAPGSPTSPAFNFLGYRSPDHGSMLLYDSKTNVVFSDYWLSNSLTCWNVNKPLDEHHVVTLYNDLKYGADLSLDPDRNLWFLLLATNANPISERHCVHEYLYQLYKVNVDQLIHGTACDPHYHG
uniref:Major royal jelly protein n=2 Tax=Lutzomyia longipalpis TaxID=7200 RepID=A0A1B0CBH6_LUTLO